MNDADGVSIPAAQTNEWLETAVTYSTVTAPELWATYRFTHWSNSSYPDTSYRDAWGRSLNPISFVLLEDTTATAHYLPSTHDSDADGVPDWFEIEYYGDLTPVADHDGEGDGFDMVDELANGTHPLYGDTFQEGGVRWAASGLVTVNLAGYPQYRLRSVPDGAVSEAAFAPPGTTISTPDLAGNVSFGFWTLDGELQQDAWGVALSKITLTMGAEDREAIAYFFAGDTDADGVPDAYEHYNYGSLDFDADSDTDGDGFGLLAEYTSGMQPRFANSHQEGGVAWADSELVTINLAGFARYTLTSLPAGTVSESHVVRNGTPATTPNMTEGSFGFWELDGVRQEDPWGVALRQVTFVVGSADRVGVAHFFGEDTDGDGITDGFEIYFLGTLEFDAESDTDGDGVSLLSEFQSGSSPVFGNSHQAGGVEWVDSELVVVNLQPYERLSRILVGGVLTDFFSPDPGVVTGIQTGSWSATAATDWDGDGDMDLFVAHEDGLRMFENVGSPRNPDFLEITTGFEGLAAYAASIGRPSLAGGDWNGDGLGDLVIGGDTGVLRLVSSDGGFASDGAGQDFATGSSRSLPALGDMDGDGHVDLIVLIDDGTAQFYANTGLPTPYAPTPVGDFLGVPVPTGTGIATGDLNQDQVLDVLVADMDGRIWEFFRVANGGFLLKSKVWGGSHGGFASGLTLASVDFESDGDLDLVAGLANGGLLALRDPSVGRPTGLTALAGATSIQLDWDPNWQSRIRGYYLYRSLASQGPWASLASDYLPLPTYLDTDVLPASLYYYYVSGVSYFFLPGNSTPRMVESLPSDIVSASAGRARLSLRRVNGKPGGFVRIPISIENALGLRGEGLSIQVGYDPNVLVPATQADASRPTVLRTGLSRDISVQDNGSTANGTLEIAGMSGQIDPGSGKLFTLQFNVSQGAAIGLSTSIGILAATLHSLEGNQVAVDFSGSEFVVTGGGFVLGDVDGDGAVTEADEDLLKVLTKPHARPPTEDERAAGDLNGDGELDQRDLVLMKRLLAGLPLDEE